MLPENEDGREQESSVEATPKCDPNGKPAVGPDNEKPQAKKGSLNRSPEAGTLPPSSCTLGGVNDTAQSPEVASDGQSAQFGAGKPLPSPTRSNDSLPHGYGTPFGQQPSHLLQFFETQMYAHATAFANAAAGAAFVSAQIAADMASASLTAPDAMQPPFPPQFLPRPPYVFGHHPMAQPQPVPYPTAHFVGPYGPMQHHEGHAYQYHQPFAGEHIDMAEGSSSHRRRKRQQHVHPSGNIRERGQCENSEFISSVPSSRGRRKRRTRNNGSFLSSELQPSYRHNNTRRRNRKIALTSSGSDGGVRIE